MTAKHPMQPIYKDEHGVIRFKANKIVEWLCETGRIDLNEIAAVANDQGFTRDDQMQLAQLLGYSVSGFGGLREADEETVAKADAEAEKLL